MYFIRCMHSLLAEIVRFSRKLEGRTFLEKVMPINDKQKIEDFHKRLTILSREFGVSVYIIPPESAAHLHAGVDATHPAENYLPYTCCTFSVIRPVQASRRWAPSTL
jgi:hypothetical protein